MYTYVPVGDTLLRNFVMASVQTDYVGEEKRPGTDCSRMCPNSHDLWELGYSCILIVLLTHILKYNSAYLALLHAVSHSRQKLLAVQRLIAYSTKFVVHSLTVLDSSDPKFLQQLVFTFETH